MASPYTLFTKIYLVTVIREAREWSRVLVPAENGAEAEYRAAKEVDATKFSAFNVETRSEISGFFWAPGEPYAPNPANAWEKNWIWTLPDGRHIHGEDETSKVSVPEPRTNFYKEFPNLESALKWCIEQEKA